MEILLDILSKIAIDVYAISVFTVASEYAFSSGDRILDEYQSSFGTKSIGGFGLFRKLISSPSYRVDMSVDDLLYYDSINRVKFCTFFFYIL